MNQLFSWSISELVSVCPNSLLFSTKMTAKEKLYPMNKLNTITMCSRAVLSLDP